MTSAGRSGYPWLRWRALPEIHLFATTTKFTAYPNPPKHVFNYEKNKQHPVQYVSDDRSVEFLLDKIKELGVTGGDLRNFEVIGLVKNAVLEKTTGRIIRVFA